VFERFTDSARRVVVQAQVEARALGHPFIGPEHLLLGLTQEEPSGMVLERFGLTHDALRDEVAQRVPAPPEPTPGHIPFTPRAKKALELSLRACVSQHHRGICPGHLLAGVVLADDGVTAGILRDHGVKAADIRVAALDSAGGVAPSRRAVTTTRPVIPGPVCPGCRAPIADCIEFTEMAGVRVVWCRACQLMLGVLAV
jgi:ATP-dependent Clp protease ATP-binding subunit ClpC